LRVEDAVVVVVGLGAAVGVEVTVEVLGLLGALVGGAADLIVVGVVGGRGRVGAAVSGSVTQRSSVSGTPSRSVSSEGARRTLTVGSPSSGRGADSSARAPWKVKLTPALQKSERSRSPACPASRLVR
jgi:hypothetical protein